MGYLACNWKKTITKATSAYQQGGIRVKETEGKLEVCQVLLPIMLE